MARRYKQVEVYEHRASVRGDGSIVRLPVKRGEEMPARYIPAVERAARAIARLGNLRGVSRTVTTTLEIW